MSRFVPVKSPYALSRRPNLLLCGALGILCAATASFKQNAKAQDPLGAAVPTGVAAPAAEEKLRGLADLFANGLYDNAIAQVTTMLKSAPDGEIAPILYYYRGWAELCVGWYDQAQSDLEKAAQTDVEQAMKGKIKVGERSIQAALQDIATTNEYLPQQTEDIKDPTDPNTTLFHVYYTEKDELTQTVLDALLLAYRIDAKMYGCRIINQTVVIFDTAVQEQAFRELGGHNMMNWSSAYSTLTGLHLCRQTPQGQPLNQTKEDLVATVVHEYNHCILRHTMGKIDLPQWFVEGLAMCAEGQVVPSKIDTNNRKIARLIGAQMLVPMQELEDRNSFKDIKAASKERELAGVKGIQPSPYDQAYSMSRFLLTQLPNGGLAQLLNGVHKTKSFDKGLDAALGMTPTEFYDSWTDAVLSKTGTPKGRR